MRRDHPKGQSSRSVRERVPEHRPDPLERACHSGARAGHDGEQPAHQVSAVAVGDDLDVGVGIGVDARGDRNRLGEVALVVRDGDRLDRLGVAAHDVTDPVAETRQRATVAAVGEQLVRPEGAGRDHDAPRRERGRAPAGEPGTCAAAGHPVPVAAVLRAERSDVGDLPLGQDLDAELLGEPEVVLHQGVLGAVPAADHAATAADAAASRGPLAAEEGIVDLDAGLAEVGADPRRLEGVADADLLAVLAQQVVRRPLVRIGRHAQHALGGVVVGGQLALPVAEPAPLGVLEERRPGPVQRVGVSQAATPDPGAGDDEEILEGRHPEDSAEPEAGHPEVAAEVPGRLGEVLVPVAAAALEDGDPVALLGEPQGGHRSAEAGPDDDPVEVEVP